MSNTRAQNTPENLQTNPSEQKSSAYNAARSLSCGIVAGAGASASIYPFEALKKYIQINHMYPWTPVLKAYFTGSNVSAARANTKPFKPFGGMNGFVGCVTGIFLVQSATNAGLKRIMPEDASNLAKITAGGISGGVGAIFGTAGENLVAHYQIMLAERRKINPKATVSSTDVILNLYRKGGLKQFLKSYEMIAPRDFCFTGCMFGGNNLAAATAASCFNGSPTAGFVGRIIASLFGTALTQPLDARGTYTQIGESTSFKNMFATRGIRGLFAGYSARFLVFAGFTNLAPVYAAKAEKAFDSLFGRGSPSLFSRRQAPSSAVPENNNTTAPEKRFTP